MKRYLLYILKFFFIVFVLFQFTGCTSKYSTIDNKQTIKKQDKAYIEFFRKDQFLGGGANIFLYEIQKDKLVPLTAMGNNQRFAYEVKEGLYRFYTTPYNIIEINAIKNKTYHVDVLPNNKYLFYALIVEENQNIESAISELTLRGCTKNVLNKYGFKENEENFKSPISLIVTCKDKKLIKFNDLKDTPSLDEINQIPIVKLSQLGKKYIDSQLSEEAQNYNDYKVFWEEKLNNVPLIDEPFIRFTKLPEENFFRKFDGVNINHKESDTQKLELITDIKTELNNYKGNNNLDIEIIVNKYFTGDFVKRFFTLQLNTKGHYASIAVIDVNVNYYDKGKIIASFNLVTSKRSGGLTSLNNFNITHSQIIEEIKNYTITNFIKQK